MSNGQTTLDFGKKSRWFDLLRGISWVESRDNPRAASYLGAKYGRGLYGVSEIALLHQQWRNWDKLNWVTPEHLYDPMICGIIAINVLEYLEEYYANKPDPMPWILSAYWQGARATDEKGIAWGYVNEVLGATNR